MNLKVLILLLCIAVACDAKKDEGYEDYTEGYGDYGGDYSNYNETGDIGGINMGGAVFAGGMEPDYYHDPFQKQGCHHRTEMFGDACYYLSDFPTTYRRAKNFCEDTGTNLVDISDMKEYAYIRMMLSAKLMDGSMKDGVNSMWVDITNKPGKWNNQTPMDWADKQPDGKVTAKMEKTEISSFGVQKCSRDSEKDSKQCVILKWTKDLPEFMWYSTDCHGNVPRYFTCEKGEIENTILKEMINGTEQLDEDPMQFDDYDYDFTPTKKKKKNKRNKDKKNKKNKRNKDKKKKKDKKKENDFFLLNMS